MRAVAWLFALPLLAYAVSGSAQTFVDHTPQSGIEHHHVDHHAIGGGVAVFDYDRDGDQDIYLTGGEGPDRLYRNDGHANFTDVSRELGIAGLSTLPTVGVLATDLNADGYLDLLITTGPGWANVLLINENGERFVNRSNAAGIRHQAWSTSATAADYDRDGDVDLYIGNYVDFSAEPFELNIVAPQPDFLYRNEGGGRFTLLPAPGPPGCTLATLFSDTDGDGLADLFVLNDFGEFYQPNHLYRNEVASFTDVSEEAGFRAAINCMGIAPGDVNQDGIADYYLTNIDVNYYYQGRADGGLDNLTHFRMAVGGSGVSWGAAFADFDNDGYLDLATARGKLLLWDDDQPNRLWRGASDRVALEPVPDALAIVGNNKARGLAYGDLNGDGKLDLVLAGIRTVTAGTAKARIFLNTTQKSGNYVRIDGAGGVSLPPSTQLTVFAGARSWSSTTVAGGSYLSSSSTPTYIGLGDADQIDSLAVRWPDASRAQTIPGPFPVNRAIYLDARTTTSQDDIQRPLQRLVTYPNPVSDILYIKGLPHSARLRSISWVAASGKRVALTRVQWNGQGASTSVPSHLPPGQYYLRAGDWVGEVVVK